MEELRARGVEATTREFKAAMNRLMSLVRRADSETVAAFDEWRRARPGSGPPA